jgi:hypothetical protein
VNAKVHSSASLSVFRSNIATGIFQSSQDIDISNSSGEVDRRKSFVVFGVEVYFAFQKRNKLYVTI